MYVQTPSVLSAFDIDTYDVLIETSRRTLRLNQTLRYGFPITHTRGIPVPLGSRTSTQESFSADMPSPVFQIQILLQPTPRVGYALGTLSGISVR